MENKLEKINFQLFAEGNPPANPPTDPPADPPVDPPANPPANPPADPPADPPAVKTYSQADLDKKIADAVAEAEKKAKMPDDEKSKYETAKKEKELADKEKDLTIRELKADAVTLLTEKGLPKEAVDMVLGDDKEMTSKNIDIFKKLIDDNVTKIVTEKLKGTPPPAGGNGAGEVDPEKMSVEEYKNWRKTNG